MLLCLAWMLYKLGSGLIGNSRMEAPVLLQPAAVVSREVATLQTGAPPTSPQSTNTAPAIAPPPTAPPPTALPSTQERVLRERQMGPVQQFEQLPENSAAGSELVVFDSLAQNLLATAETTVAAADDLPPDSVDSSDANDSGAVQSDDLLIVRDKKVKKGNAATNNGLSVIASADTLQNQGTAKQTAAGQVPDTESFLGNPSLMEDSLATVDIAQLEGEIWIHAQQPFNYTVQYGTSTSRALMQDFLTLFPVGKRGVLFRFEKTNSEDQIVYGLVHGIYGTVAEALADIENMPEAVRDYKPWVRRLDQIQRVVQKSQ